MNENTLITTKIFNRIVTKVKKFRKSFCKKPTSNITNDNFSKSLSTLPLDTVSLSKTYVKSNSSNYSNRDNSLDLVRDDKDNYKIVLSHNRFNYFKNKKIKEKM